MLRFLKNKLFPPNRDKLYISFLRDMIEERGRQNWEIAKIRYDFEKSILEGEERIYRRELENSFMRLKNALDSAI